MYKFRSNNYVKWNPCPMGTLRDSTVVECYWYGIMKIDDCHKCTVRKDKKKIKK